MPRFRDERIYGRTAERKFYGRTARRVNDDAFIAEGEDEFYAGPDEGPTCSICDGLGHGYPGGPPCPLEDRGFYTGEPDWAL